MTELKKRRQIVFASDCRACDDCGEPYCDLHDQHYADCECFGPSEECEECGECGADCECLVSESEGDDNDQ